MTDHEEIGRLIAWKYHEGKTYKVIAAEILDETGHKMTPQAVGARLRTMRKSGTINDLVDPNAPDEDAEMIREILGDEPGQLFRVGVYDIETTGLYADFGYILCACFYDINMKTFDVCRIDDTEYYQNRDGQSVEYWKEIDKQMVAQISDTWDKYDVIIHFNGRQFDNKFINTRLTKYQLPLLSQKKQIDMYSIARYRMSLKSKRLDALKHFFGLDEYEDGHDWTLWQMAANGQKIGLDHVVHHCKRDCVRLAAVARKMKSHIKYIS